MIYSSGGFNGVAAQKLTPIPDLLMSFHASEASARVDDLPVSISAVLMAEACNIGLEPLIRSNVPALTRHRLNWTKAELSAG